MIVWAIAHIFKLFSKTGFADPFRNAPKRSVEVPLGCNRRFAAALSTEIIPQFLICNYEFIIQATAR